MRKLAILLSGFLFFGSLASADSRADDFKTPELTGPVVDEVGVLGAQEKREIESLLRALKEKNKAQFTVLITPTLQGLSIEEYGIKLADRWKLGSEKEDNGLILIVAPKDRRMRFEVGRGLEGDIPDVVARRVLDDTMRPYFKDGDMSGGIAAGVVEISRILGFSLEDIKQAIPAAQSRSRTSSASHGTNKNGYKLIFFGLIFFIRFLGPAVLGAVVGAFGYLLFGIIGGVCGFLIGFMIGLLVFSRFGGRSSWLGTSSRWSSGGGGFGGFSGGGGGWSGGGGSFGGGGSSSRW